MKTPLHPQVFRHQCREDSRRYGAEVAFFFARQAKRSKRRRRAVTCVLVCVWLVVFNVLIVHLSLHLGW